ncbi:MAG: DEAD/DEAH box helicase [Candidatus Micrarchaeota archaeon]
MALDLTSLPLHKEKLSFREYQHAIAQSALEKGNTLVILPTGLGKTVVAVLIIASILAKGGRVLFLAPTKPLAEQHGKRLREFLSIPEDEIVVLTGETKASGRKALWGRAKIIAATPQTVQNDLKKERASMENFKLAIFDEVHRTVGKYAYNYVAEKCLASKLLILGLTASPGSSQKKIKDVVESLGIQNIELRAELDEDVAKYTMPMDVSWIKVELPLEFVILKTRLEELISEHMRPLKELGFIWGNPKMIPKRALMEMRARILSARNPQIKFKAISHHAALFNLVHAHELLETQGMHTFLTFFKRLGEREDKSKAVLGILNNPMMIHLLADAQKLNMEHPKLAKLCEVLKAREKNTFIVFVQYRDQISKIVSEINKISGMHAVAFIGKREGVSQKQQKETIEAFRNSEFNVLVASSIGEEGLDIPSVDTVIFYEPIPSEIRTIQRRGRAGRAKAGEVVVLITSNTRDEAYYWVSRKREEKMKRIVERFQRSFSKKSEVGLLAKKRTPPPQSTARKSPLTPIRNKARERRQTSMSEFLS